MAITKEKKEKVIRELEDLFSRQKLVIFADFKGMTVDSLSDLRSKVRESGGTFVVAKKTLIKKALGANKPQDLDPLALEGQIALTVGFEDIVSTAKAVYEMQKEIEMPQILMGLVGDKIASAEDIRQLALLPSQEELLANVVRSINAPVSGFVNVLGGTLRSLVYALSAIQNQKS